MIKNDAFETAIQDDQVNAFTALIDNDPSLINVSYKYIIEDRVIKSEIDDSALCIAAKFKAVDIFTLLLERGATIDVATESEIKRIRQQNSPDKIVEAFDAHIAKKAQERIIGIVIGILAAALIAISGGITSPLILFGLCLWCYLLYSRYKLGYSFAKQ